MAEDTVSAPTASKPVRRRRASRAAGPASDTAATGVGVEAPKPLKVRISKPGPPPRRQPNRTLVAIVALATAFVAAAGMGVFTWLAFDSTRHIEAGAPRNPEFV